jgi:hypothetical protein
LSARYYHALQPQSKQLKQLRGNRSDIRGVSISEQVTSYALLGMVKYKAVGNWAANKRNCQLSDFT